MNPPPPFKPSSLPLAPFTLTDPETDALDDLIGEPDPMESAPAPAEPASTGTLDFLKTYGLRENPFADSVHPAFFFRTEAHGEAFRDMMLAADFKTSLGMVTGPSGMGKTLLTQLLLQSFDEARYEVILVLVTPGLSKTGLLREILSELGIALPVGIARVQDLVKILSNHIIDLHQEGRRLVVMLDEVHLLSADCLHIVRTVSNIETPEEKLTTCLIFGEARLAQRLTHPSFESLRNRIYLRHELHPLNAAESAQCIRYRLMIAGRLTPLFTEEALALLHAKTEGIIRSLNKLAMLSLLHGAASGKTTIDEECVTTAARRM